MQKLLMLAILAGAAIAAPSSVWSQVGGEGKPPAVHAPPNLPGVPPPPPLPKAPHMLQALNSARKCFSTRWEQDILLRNKALAITQDLKAEPGSAAWLKARDVVVAYLRHRRTLLPCISELESVQPGNGRPYADWRILQQHAASMRVDYSRQSKFELMLMMSLLDSDLAEQEAHRPWH